VLLPEPAGPARTRSTGALLVEVEERADIRE
jgi:hypothetical protein